MNHDDLKCMSDEERIQYIDDVMQGYEMGLDNYVLWSHALKPAMSDRERFGQVVKYIIESLKLTDDVEKANDALVFLLATACMRL